MAIREKTTIPVLILLTLLSCGKPDLIKPDPQPDPDPEPPEPPTTVTKTYQEQLADTLYKLAQQVFYWNTALPDSATFKPLSYVRPDTLAGLQNQLFRITQLPLNPETGKAYEFFSSNGTTATSSKYSYLVKTSDLYNGGVAAAAFSNAAQVAEMKMTLDGKDNDLGLSVGLIPAWFAARGVKDTLAYQNPDSTLVFVRSVTRGSPADNAGLKRGDLIANAELNTQNALISALKGNALKLIVYRPKTKTRDTLETFTKAVYTFDPVLNDTLLTVGAKKIGYIAYQSFTTGTNSQPALDAAFDRFQCATDMVVDLRENGGGYVDVAAYLINLLAPQSSNGKVAFAEHYNQTMQRKQATILRHQKVYINNEAKSYTYFDIDYSLAGNTKYISKTKGVNQNNSIKNLYFIVSGRTASASELVINSLKPYFDKVVLIGSWFSDDGTLTYGKPIGFFELRLGTYSMFLSSFETKNALGTGGYYAGFSTDYQDFDDVRYNYGDPNESSFLRAIQLITNNPTYTPTATTRRSVYTSPAPAIKGIAIGQPATVHGMISTPRQKL